MGEGVKYQSLGSHNKSLVGDKPLWLSLFKGFFFLITIIGKPEMSIIFFSFNYFLGNVC